MYRLIIIRYYSLCRFRFREQPFVGRGGFGGGYAGAVTAYSGGQVLGVLVEPSVLDS